MCVSSKRIFNIKKFIVNSCFALVDARSRWYIKEKLLIQKPYRGVFVKVKDFLRAAILKSIVFNYRFFSLKKAWKLPVILYPGTTVLAGCGKILLPEKLKMGMIKIGREETFQCIGEKLF